MAATRGRLDPQGCPLATVAIFAEGRPAAAKEFEALIDTGFTGFAQMPTRDAAALGLAPVGEMELTFRDGTTEPVPVAWASIRLGSETREGFVFLSEGDEVLVGVHFLRLFGKTLIHSVRDEGVVLTDQTLTDLA